MQNLIKAFIADVCGGQQNETPRAYRNKLSHLLRHFDGHKMTQEELEEFRQTLIGRAHHHELSLFTVRTILTTTRHFLRWGSERGLFGPFQIRNIKEPRPEPKAIRAEVFEKLVAICGCVGPEWYQVRNLAILYTLRDTGGRVGCICRMEMGQLMLEEGYALAPDKGGQLTTLFFCAATVAALRAWVEIRGELGPGDDFVFSGARRKGITRQGVIRMLDRLAIAAGCQNERHNPHSFRHAFARDSLLAGADLSSVSQMMGHKSIVVTANYYARWSRKELKNLHRKFSPGRML